MDSYKVQEQYLNDDFVYSYILVEYKDSFDNGQLYKCTDSLYIFKATDLQTS